MNPVILRQHFAVPKNLTLFSAVCSPFLLGLPLKRSRLEVKAIPSLADECGFKGRNNRRNIHSLRVCFMVTYLVIDSMESII